MHPSEHAVCVITLFMRSPWQREPPVITDDTIGLMWLQDDDGITRSWQVDELLQELVLADYTDWCLPSKDELKGLLVCSNGVATPFNDFLVENPSCCGEAYSAILHVSFYTFGVANSLHRSVV